MSLFSWLFSESGNSRGLERGKNTGEGNSQKSRHYDLHPNEQVSARQTGNSVVLAAEGERHKGRSCALENVMSLNHGCRTGRLRGQNLKLCNTWKPTVEDLQKFRHRIVM